MKRRRIGISGTGTAGFGVFGDGGAVKLPNAEQTFDIAAALGEAVAHLRAARPGKAEVLCRKALKNHPDHPDEL